VVDIARIVFTCVLSFLNVQAMIQWEMIQEGDRLLLGLSGGKDSLSLLHCLLELQRKLPIKFDIEVSQNRHFASTIGLLLISRKSHDRFALSIQ
jgi:hypothetical protein